MAEEKQTNEVTPETNEVTESQEQVKTDVEPTATQVEKASKTTVVQDKKIDPPKEDSSCDKNAILELLATVTAELEDTRKVRRRQGRYAIFGIVFTAAILIALMANLYHFGTNYPVDQLLAQISANSNIVTDSPDVHRVVGSARKVFLPAYKKNLLSACKPKLLRSSLLPWMQLAISGIIC